MGRIIIHIGTHKTGTTSIQRTLDSYRRRLRLRGIHYPNYSTIGKKPHYAHLAVANGLANDHRSFRPEDAEEFLRHVRATSADHDVTLLSAEPFYRQTLGNVSPQDTKSPQEYWTIRDRYIARLRDQVGPAELAIVLRRQDEFAESIYQEHVKVTRYARPFERYIEDFWFHFLYDQQIAAWARHFDKIHIISFDSIKGGNITKNFLGALDLSPGRIETVPMQNIGMPHDGVILKRFYNGEALNKAELTILANAMTSPAFRDAVTPGKRSFFCSEGARRAFLARLRAENSAVAARMGVAQGPGEKPNAVGAEGDWADVFQTGIPGDIHYGDTLPDSERARLVSVLKDILAGELALPAMPAT